MSQTPLDSQPRVSEIFEKCVGCKWTLHVIAQIRQGVQRPGQLERTADGLTTKVLNERLVKLVRFEILEKVSYPEVPPRVEYRLTEFGNRFANILDQVAALQEEFDVASGSSRPESSRPDAS